LADHTHRLADLTDILKIHHQRTQVQAHIDGEQCPGAAGERIVDMGDIAHSRHDGTGKGLSCRCTAAVGLIALRKALPRLFLMVEYLDDLLSLDHLLDISIDNTNVPLLLCKEVAAAL